MKKLIITMALALLSIASFAQTEHKATVWGVKSDGITDNTASIQRAVDFISEHGGGTLVFYVGRYVTGAIELKSNVTIRLEEAAVLVGTTNIYGYKGAKGLIWADGQTNVAVTGKGVIEGRCSGLQKSIDEQKTKGYLPAETALPALYSFENCQNAVIGDEIKLVKDLVKNHKK